MVRYDEALILQDT